MSLKRDHRRPVPDWLAHLQPAELQVCPFPLSDVLRHSLYYPAAGLDGRPVQFLGGFIHSFIYVDYGVEERAVDSEIQTPGFLGYHLVGRRALNEHDLAPNGWHQHVPPQYNDQVCAFNEARYHRFVGTPYATWYIFDREHDRGEDHGPQRFSLVYLCADGIAAYQALYWQNHIAPEVLAIIQPGHGLGGNYTDFTDPDGFLAWTVLYGNGQHVPEFLVCGKIGPLNQTEAFWPDAYPHHVEWFQHVNGNGIWRRGI